MKLALAILSLLQVTAHCSPLEVTFNGITNTDGKCICNGTQDGGESGKAYICRDKRLGPKRVPRMIPLRNLVSSYDLFGGLSPGEFLAKWTDDNGRYVYPPQNGFQLDTSGNPINATMLLQPGTLVDRFGSEYGTYIYKHHSDVRLHATVTDLHEM